MKIIPMGLKVKHEAYILCLSQYMLDTEIHVVCAQKGSSENEKLKPSLSHYWNQLVLGNQNTAASEQRAGNCQN